MEGCRSPVSNGTLALDMEDNHRMSPEEIADALIAIAYRLATYMVNNVIDDPAMLAIVFC